MLSKPSQTKPDQTKGAEDVAGMRQDLAGPGPGDYAELAKELPRGYQTQLGPRETQLAITELKRTIEDGLCRELGLIRVQVPLIVDASAGLNDYLDRDGSRTPVSFHISNDGDANPIDAEVVQAATKWKRTALAQFAMRPGEGLYTDMHAIRKDYFLDHDHSAFVDQWDWEKAIRSEDRNLATLTDTVQRIWRVLKDAEQRVREFFPALRNSPCPELPEEITFVHAEELLERYPNQSRKERETSALKQHPALFIYGIGWPLADGLPHELRAADYDDWASETRSADGRPMHGLNGDILVLNPVTGRRHELSSMGIRVDATTLRTQLEMSGQLGLLRHGYHQAILNGDLPQSVGGGIGQSRTYMLLLEKAHIGEVSVSVWPEILKAMCRERNIHLLE